MQVHVLLRINIDLSDEPWPCEVVNVYPTWESARAAMWPDFKKLLLDVFEETEEGIKESCEKESTYRDGEVDDEDSSAFRYEDYLYQIRRKIIRP